MSSKKKLPQITPDVAEGPRPHFASDTDSSRRPYVGLSDDDPVPAADDIEGLRRNLRDAVRDIDITTGGAEGDLGGAATAGAELTTEGLGDWKGSNPGVPGTEFPESEDERGNPDGLRIFRQRVPRERGPAHSS